MAKIGRIKEVKPRDAWNHEAHDFTPWLFENLELLGESIDLQLEPEGCEVAVDRFSADILAREAVDGKLVLIENQLETTDHKHLGQLLTYLAGLDTEIVVWVATEFREPHLSAVKWLNEHTADGFSFFAVKLRVVSIDNGPLAPLFDVIERPNQWNREMKRVREKSTSSSSDIAELRKEFWGCYLRRYPDDESFGVRITSAPAIWAQPSKNIDLYVSMYKARNSVGVSLRGPRGTLPDKIHELFVPHAERFVSLVGDCDTGNDSKHPADWLKIDMDDRGNWDEAIDWLHGRTVAFLDAAVEVFDSDQDKVA